VSSVVRYAFGQRVFLYDAYVKYDQLESVGENSDVNFVMKGFPAEKQLIILWINVERDPK
jgi:hypothetical protein